MLRFRIHRGLVSLLREAQGAALLEFAIVLPLLMVFVVGIYDFSGAFNEKQKIAQAAQEGAIIAGSQPMSDIQTSTTTGPASLLPVQTAIVNSLVSTGVVTTSCNPVTGSGGPNLTWTYTIAGCPGSLVITINRGWKTGSGTAASPASLGTVVTVQYPYTWRFNKVIQLIVPGANYAAMAQL